MSLNVFNTFKDGIKMGSSAAQQSSLLCGSNWQWAHPPLCGKDKQTCNRIRKTGATHFVFWWDSKVIWHRTQNISAPNPSSLFSETTEQEERSDRAPTLKRWAARGLFTTSELLKKYHIKILEEFLFWVGLEPHPVMLREHFWRAQGTLQDTKDRTQVSHLQGKCPTY